MAPSAYSSNGFKFVTDAGIHIVSSEDLGMGW